MTALACADCGTGLVHDTEAERWLGGTILYDPDQVDGATDGRDNGETCPATGDPHRTAAAS